MIDYKKTYLNFFSANNIAQESSFLLAVSGGIDSMSLLHLAISCNQRVQVAHVNYQLRGNDSDLDEKLVANYCKQKGVTAHIKKTTISSDNNIQLEARKIRYAFFKEVVKKEKLDYIITAHHQNDDQETFILNIIRGSGLAGLKSIPYKRDNILRPLLNFNKSQLTKYVSQNKIPYREDISNYSDKYDRNFIRNNLFPILYEKFAQSENGIAKSIQFIKKDNTLLNELVDEKLKPYIEQNKDSITLNYSPTISNHCYAIYLTRFGFNHDQIETWINTKSQSGKFIYNEQYRLVQDRNCWIISTVNHDINNQTHLLHENEMLSYPIHLNCKVHSSINKSFKSDSNIAFFNLEKLSFPLELRKWKSGDKMKPLGMKGNKKISDILIDKKIPLTEKEKTYVLISNNEIIWLVGVTISDDYKVISPFKSTYEVIYTPQ